MKTAIVHDWLVGMRGGERCLEVIASIFPGADIFTLFYDPSGISESINRHRVVPSHLNKLPGVDGYYRHLLPFYGFGVSDLGRKIERLGPASAETAFGGYDLVISISHCVAKNIRVPNSVPHLCYCLTPVRYLWDQYDAYFAGRPIEPLIRLVAGRLRRRDVEGSKSVNKFVAISRFVAERISAVYGRSSSVVYPPVRTDWITPAHNMPAGDAPFLCASALVPYKNVHLAVDAFNQLALPLLVVGAGPEERRLKAMAGKTIKFVSRLSDQELSHCFSESKALVFAAVEDFGMVPVEIQAAGRPVIALGQGGALETVIGSGTKQTGIFFPQATTDSLIGAVEDFMSRQQEISVDNCISQGQSFSEARFVDGFISSLDDLVSAESLRQLRGISGSAGASGRPVPVSGAGAERIMAAG
jgi:glycosyltransferase involved in cell wall biosynthesis